MIFFRSLVFLLVISFCLTSPLFAQNSLDHRVVQIDAQLHQWRSDLEIWKSNPPRDDIITARLNYIRSILLEVKSCEKERNDNIQSITAKLAALGELSDEADIVATRRKELDESKQTNEQTLALCRLIRVGADELEKEVKALKRSASTLALFHKDLPIWQSNSDFDALLKILKKPTFSFHLHAPAFISSLILFFGIYPFLYFFSTRVKRRAQNPETSVIEKKVLNSYRANLFISAVMFSFTVYLLVSGLTFLATLSAIIGLLVLISPIVQGSILLWDPDTRMGWSVRYFLGISAIVTIFYYLPEFPVTPGNNLVITSSLTYCLLGLFGAFSLIGIARSAHARIIRIALLMISIAILSGPTLYMVGFRQLGQMLVLGVHGSVGTFIVAALLYRPFQLTLKALEINTDAPNHRFRNWLGFQPDEQVPGLRTTHFIFLGMITIGLVIGILSSWQVAPSDIKDLLSIFSKGFTIGSVSIVPIKIVAAIVGFVAVLTMARWVRKQVSAQILSKSKLDQGAQHAILSVTGYIFIAIAFLAALAVAGFELQNLAILAGALSVGIGFGLQNIVNNFVSGLILLFERPIRPGDWVVVGATEGYVVRISIRSTLIQTFDRADVLVPNSELISNHVKNWTLQDPYSRVVLPIGVAYGTDVDLVREILIDLAKAHSMVLTQDYRVSPPVVMFMGFGASSLDFELRCFIRRADYMLSVRSDLNYQINAKFAQLGIEIPFPQRVVHLHNSSDEINNPQ